MAASASAPADCPARLGEFEILGLLGRGGSGAVYAARDGARRDVALKVLHEDLSLSDHERRRFIEEAARMRRVTHDGLVALLDSGELPDGRPYIAMPRLHGETLTRRLKRGPLPVEEGLAVFQALAEAVGALHAAGLLHRDIKPANIFLVGGPDPVRPVLLDFGIARELGDPTGTTTQAGRVRGTPAYMAPERLFGTGATVRSDVYELAVTLYSMLVGRRPWDQDNDAESRLNPKRPEDFGVELPGTLSRCLLRALSTRPELRPSGVLEFARAVSESVTVEGSATRETMALPIAVELDPTTEVAQKASPRRPRRVAMAAASLAVIGVAATAAFAALRPHSASAPAPARAAVASASAATIAPPVASVVASAPVEVPSATPAAPPAPLPAAAPPLRKVPKAATRAATATHPVPLDAYSYRK